MSRGRDWVCIRVPRKQAEYLLAESMRRRNNTGLKPNMAELVREAIDDFISALRAKEDLDQVKVKFEEMRRESNRRVFGRAGVPIGGLAIADKYLVPRWPR